MAGPDGALWFTLYKLNIIGRITTSGVVTLFNCPTPDLQINANSITSGPDGALWFTQSNLNKIGRITTFGSMTEYTLPVANSSPGAITVGPPDPDVAVWFTEGFGRNKIGKLSFLTYPINTSTTGVGGLICNPNPVMESTDALCTITPSSGYHIGDVSAGSAGLAVTIGARQWYLFGSVIEDKDIQVSFVLNDIRVYHGGLYQYNDSSIQIALNDHAMQSGDWIEVPAGVYVEDTGFTVNRNDGITFTLSGGWDSGFLANAGEMTMIAGNLTIEGTGGLIIDRIAIQ